jgi:hypothetical protein
MQLMCNSTVLVTMGGGGGRGFWLHGDKVEFGAGGGAGLQVFGHKSKDSENGNKWQGWGSGQVETQDNDDELKLILSVGGGGGGGSGNGTTVESGTAADPDRLLPPNWKVIKVDLARRLRRCWLAGELVVRGSGGLGAGFADVVHGDATAMHLGYHFSLSLNMCYSPASACAAGRLIDDSMQMARRPLFRRYRVVLRARAVQMSLRCKSD